MAEKYAELRAALDAGPTEGPWHSYKKCVFLRDEGGFSMAECPRPAENADYIAAANPETVRSLLAERDALREALQSIVDCCDDLADTADIDEFRAAIDHARCVEGEAK